jgi:hypothetical protein
MRYAKLSAALIASLIALLSLTTAAQANANAPWWQLSSGARPTNLPPEGSGEIVLFAENLGDANVDGAKTPVQITDTLPPGLKAVGIAATHARPGSGLNPIGEASHSFLPCSLASLTCTLDGTLVPYDQIEVRIAVEVQAEAQSGEVNRVSISGGEAPSAALQSPLTVSGEPTPFDVEDYRLGVEEEGGSLATRAGSHPFQVTGTVAINQGPDTSPLSNYLPDAEPAALAKDVFTKLPAGQIGNTTPFPACSLAQFLTNPEGIENACPAKTAVGVATVVVNEPAFLEGALTLTQPIFNLEPSAGEPARFGFFVAIANVPVLLDTSLRSESDYGVNVNVTNISQTAGLTSAKVTFWGVPGDPRHDSSRGWGCLFDSRGGVAAEHPLCTASEAPKPPPLLFLSTSCAGPLQTSVEADSWTQAGVFKTRVPDSPLQSMDGCNQVPFSPTIAAEPTSDAATSPTGLNFDINVNDEGLDNPKGLVQSQIKKAVITLPEGFTTNPSVAEGLHACTSAQYESETVNSEAGTGCPNESKIGDVEVESPLVTQKVKGSLYVATQHQNPYGNLLTLYLVAKNPELGIIIKQALKVSPDPKTGQLTTEVDNIPQLPFSHFRLSFRQGQRSPLITPPACGTYTVKADLYPWSEPSVPLHDTSSFQITQGPEGNPCPSGGLPPFKPDLEAGTLNNAAGTYSPFYVHMSRKDSEQEITHFSIKLPPGVIGKLAGIPFCPDAAIAAAKAREHEGGGQEELASPSCSAASQVGRSLVGSGVGNVLAYAPGKMYLAGPYHGSALSLVSITAAKVGPFDLGTVVVRFALRIDPETAEVFVDATGSDPIPHIVDGIPVHLRDIRAYVDRPNFVLNPTGCEKTSTASTVLGSGLNFATEADDRPVTVSSPFQAADCAALAFKPKLALKLKGGTTRGSHPAFSATLRMKGHGESNIKRAQVTLPRSEFLENAHIKTICTRVQFRAKACPAASIYGYAKATTPLLSDPVAGPVYLRSSEHQLPDLVAELKNGEIEVDLVGRIDSLEGRIRNTFEAAPDAPVSTFTLKMQGGKKGLLVNSTNLCKGTHRAIAAFTAHNGKVSEFNPELQAKCGAKGRKGKAKHRRAG